MPPFSGAYYRSLAVPLVPVRPARILTPSPALWPAALASECLYAAPPEPLPYRILYRLSISCILQTTKALLS